MTQTTTGWVVFIAAVGMMFSLLAVDIVALKDFNQMYTPLFIGTFMGHIAAVIAAFIGGKLIPENRPEGTHTRSNDIPKTTNDGSNI
jgi:hypothetical protein